MSNRNRKMNKSLIRLLLLLAIVLIVAFVMVRVVPELVELLRIGDMAAIEEYIEGSGKSAAFILVVLQVLQTITIVFPGIPIYMCAGIVFGRVKGTLLCYVTYVIVNMAVFLFSRRTREAAGEVFRVKTDKDNFIEELMHTTRHPALLVAALCVVPIIPNGIIPHIAANSTLTEKSFLKAVTVGCIPGICLFVFCGDLLMSEYFPVVIALLIAAVVLMIVGFICKDKITAFVERMLKNFLQ